MIIVYTAILGDCDSLKPAPSGADLCECFVDDPAKYPDTKGWTLRKHLKRQIGFNDSRREAWHLRCVPHLLYLAYDRVVWIDASFTLLDVPLLLKHAGAAPIAALRHHDRSSCFEEGRELVKMGQAPARLVDPQLKQYRQERFHPQHLSISCVIVRDRSATAAQFNETWDQQIERHHGDNTQLSIDYAAWKAGTSIRALRGTRKQNPYATHAHRDHRRRRKPYLVPA